MINVDDRRLRFHTQFYSGVGEFLSKFRLCGRKKTYSGNCCLGKIATIAPLASTPCGSQTHPSRECRRSATFTSMNRWPIRQTLTDSYRSRKLMGNTSLDGNRELRIWATKLIRISPADARFYEPKRMHGRASKEDNRFFITSRISPFKGIEIGTTGKRTIGLFLCTFQRHISCLNVVVERERVESLQQLGKYPLQL